MCVDFTDFTAHQDDQVGEDQTWLDSLSDLFSCNLFDKIHLWEHPGTPSDIFVVA